MQQVPSWSEFLPVKASADDFAKIVLAVGGIAILTDILKTVKPPMRLGAFTASNTTSIPLLNSPNDMLMFFAHRTDIFDVMPNVRHHLLAATISPVGGVQKTVSEACDIAKAENFPMVVYDPEGWDATADDEKTNIPLHCSRAADIVKAKGLRYGYAPIREYLVNNYRNVNWQKVDFLTMQMQRAMATTGIENTINNITSTVKQANPNCEIFLQVNTDFATVTRILEVIGKVTNINGVQIVYGPTANNDVLKALR